MNTIEYMVWKKLQQNNLIHYFCESISTQLWYIDEGKLIYGKLDYYG